MLKEYILSDNLSYHRKLKLWALLLLFLCLFSQISAQSPNYFFVLSGNESGAPKTYKARNYISLLPGFVYTAAPQNSFLGTIVPNIVIDASTLNPTGSSQQGDSLTTAVLNTTGNTFSSYNPANPATGLTTNSIGYINGNTVKKTVSYIYPIIWFKTIPVSTDIQYGYYAWRDFSGNNVKLRKYDARGASFGDEYIVPKSAIKTYNFNPALNISFEQVSKEIMNAKSNLSQATIMGIWGPNEENGTTTDNFVFAVNGRQAESILFAKSKIVESAESKKGNLYFGNDKTKNLLYQSNLLSENTENKFKEQSLRIATYYKADKPNNSVWSEDKKSVISLGYNFDKDNKNNTSTFSAGYNGYAGYKGYTPELLVFNKILTGKECNIYQSYLALKYGLSLDTTYTSSNGKIMWNYNENTLFNNRITGYSRQDALGLYQTTSTTSYEEVPYFSSINGNDSYDGCDLYKQSSPNKLLVVGNEPASLFYDGDFVLFGDNNETVSLSAGNNIPNYRTLNRRWLLTKNISILPNLNVQLNWDPSSTLEISETNFKSAIRKPASLSAAAAVTSVPLQGKDGYMSWTANSLSGTTVVKFGLKNTILTVNNADYGFTIKNNGKVYKIERGKEDLNYFINLYNNQRVEVEKNGNIIFMRIDGQRIKGSECLISNSSDIKASYYGAISIQNASEVILTDFRHGGFVNTGSKIELSYNTGRASDLALNKNNVYLIVDRTGTGNFNSVTSGDVYQVSEVDIKRSKLIFHNIFWDVDKNGKDVFTFGYVNSSPSQIAKQNPEQDNNIKDGNSVSVYYKDINDWTQFIVKIYLCKEEPYTVMVYDISGRAISKNDYIGNKQEQFFDISLPNPGFYVVKVISKSFQYSTKIISRQP